MVARSAEGHKRQRLAEQDKLVGSGGCERDGLAIWANRQSIYVPKRRTAGIQGDRLARTSFAERRTSEPVPNHPAAVDVIFGRRAASLRNVRHKGPSAVRRNCHVTGVMSPELKRLENLPFGE